MSITIDEETALLTQDDLLTEVKRTLRASGSNQAPDVVEDRAAFAINRASGIVQQVARRKLRSSATTTAVTEYHDVRAWSSELQLGGYPVIAISDVREDSDRLYTTAALVADTDYILVEPETGLLERIEADATTGAIRTTTWLGGRESVRVQYTFGFANIDDVPEEFRSPAIALAGRIYDLIERGQPGVSASTDSAGNFTRFGPELLTRAETALVTGGAEIVPTRTWRRR